MSQETRDQPSSDSQTGKMFEMMLELQESLILMTRERNEMQRAMQARLEERNEFKSQAKKAVHMLVRMREQNARLITERNTFKKETKVLRAERVQIEKKLQQKENDDFCIATDRSTFFKPTTIMVTIEEEVKHSTGQLNRDCNSVEVEEKASKTATAA